MRIHQRVWHYFRQHKVSTILVKGGQVTFLGLLLVGATLDIGSKEAQAHTNCAAGEHLYDGLKGSREGVRLELQGLPHPTQHPDYSHSLQQTCLRAWIEGNSKRFAGKAHNSRKAYNIFPYGQCTWWANQRYFQLHGTYVPWKTKANAWQWKFRAFQFHWHVSTKPKVGAIIDLQPWVEGAYTMGHVAIVERVLGNGHVIASTMNWGAFPGRVSYVEFAPRQGVSFISQ